MFNVTYPPTDPEPCPCTMLALEPRPHPNLEPAAARAFEDSSLSESHALSTVALWWGRRLGT